MSVRLAISCHSEGAPAGEQPVSNRRLDQTGERVVMRQQLRGLVALFLTTPSKHFRGSLMQLPAALAQKHAVRNVPDQHVVEGIALEPNGAGAAYQPRLAE